MKIHPDFRIWLEVSVVKTESRFVWNNSGRPAGQEYQMNIYLVEEDNRTAMARTLELKAQSTGPFLM